MHFIHEPTEAQRDCVTCSGEQKQLVGTWGAESQSRTTGPPLKAQSCNRSSFLTIQILIPECHLPWPTPLPPQGPQDLLPIPSLLSNKQGACLPQDAPFFQDPQSTPLFGHHTKLLELTTPVSSALPGASGTERALWDYLMKDGGQSKGGGQEGGWD